MKNPVRRKVFVVGACTAAFVAAGGAGTAFAGEVTGNGKPLPVNGKSICAFSGQNDEYQAGDTSAPRAMPTSLRTPLAPCCTIQASSSMIAALR